MQENWEEKIVFVKIFLFSILSIYVWDNFTNHWTFFTMKNAFFISHEIFFEPKNVANKKETKKNAKLRVMNGIRGLPRYYSGNKIFYKLLKFYLGKASCFKDHQIKWNSSWPKKKCFRANTRTFFLHKTSIEAWHGR